MAKATTTGGRPDPGYSAPQTVVGASYSGGGGSQGASQTTYLPNFYADKPGQAPYQHVQPQPSGQNIVIRETKTQGNIEPIPIQAQAETKTLAKSPFEKNITQNAIERTSLESGITETYNINQRNWQATGLIPHFTNDAKKFEQRQADLEQKISDAGISPMTVEYMLGAGYNYPSEEGISSFISIAKNFEGMVGTTKQKDEWAQYQTDLAKYKTEMKEISSLAESQGYKGEDVSAVLRMANQTKPVGFVTKEGKEVLLFSPTQGGENINDFFIPKPLSFKQPTNMTEAVSIANQEIVKGNAEYNTFKSSFYRIPSEESMSGLDVMTANPDRKGIGLVVRSDVAYNLDVAEKQRKYEEHLPGGKEFGFGAMERFKYASDLVLGKEGETDFARGLVKGGVNIIGGVPTYTADVGAQAVKNVPDLFKESYRRTKNGGPGGWSVLGEAGSFTAKETIKGVGQMATRGGEAIGGNPVAIGESVVMVGSVLAPVVTAKTGRPVIDWASTKTRTTTKASRTFDTLTGGTEFPISHTDTYISVGWEKGSSFSIYGGAKVTSSEATGKGVSFYKGEPTVIVGEGGFTSGPKPLTPYQTKITDIYAKSQTKFLENMKPAEQEGFAIRQAEYLKSSNNPDVTYNRLLKEYSSGVGKSSYSELKEISVLSSEKGTPRPAQTLKQTINEVSTLQTPDTPGVTGKTYEYITQARTGDVFGSTSQQVFMGKEAMGRSIGDVDMMANQPGFTTSIRAGKQPLRLATPEVQLGSSTIKGVKYRLSDVEYPTARITPTSELVAREVVSEISPYYVKGRVKQEGGLVTIDKPHAFDIHDQPSGFYSTSEGGGYTGFGKPTEKSFYISEGRNVILDKLTFEKGVGLQRLSEQAIAKGVSSANPIESGIGFGPEAHRLKDIYDTVKIGEFQAKRTGDMALLGKVEAYKAKLPEGFMEYFKGTEAGVDTPLIRAENQASFARSKASTSAVESSIISKGFATGGSLFSVSKPTSKHSVPASASLSFVTSSIPSSPSSPSKSLFSSTSSSLSRSSLSSKPSSPSYSIPSSSPSFPSSPSILSSPSSISKLSYPSSPSQPSSPSYPSSPSKPSYSSKPSSPSYPSYPSSPSKPSYSYSPSPPPPPSSIILPGSLGNPGLRNRIPSGGFPRFKLPKYKSKLQPRLTLLEKTRLEIKSGKAVSSFVPSTPKTRATFIKSGLGAFGYSGLLGKARKATKGLGKIKGLGKGGIYGKRKGIL